MYVHCAVTDNILNGFFISQNEFDAKKAIDLKNTLILEYIVSKPWLHTSLHSFETHNTYNSTSQRHITPCTTKHQNTCISHP